MFTSNQSDSRLLTRTEKQEAILESPTNCTALVWTKALALARARNIIVKGALISPETIIRTGWGMHQTDRRTGLGLGLRLRLNFISELEMGNRSHPS